MSRVKTSVIAQSFSRVAEPTGLEPATSDVTGRRSNQLNYDSALRTFNVNPSVKRMGGTGFEPVAPGL